MARWTSTRLSPGQWAAALLALAVTCYVVIPPTVGALRASASPTITVIGQRAVEQSQDELERRLRQAGFRPLVIVVDSCDALDNADLRGRIVLAMEEWAGCGSLPDVEWAVESPLGDTAPPSVADRRRDGAPMFGADDMPCMWWDIPGPGEVRPGLGKCADTGLVTVVADGALTEPGKERFARLVVEAVR